ncbi:MAG TPA: hypothetical protein VM425_09190 [Myxococcota bacterium]|nr:hypothetical protein [Myxococcota bacterium]
MVLATEQKDKQDRIAQWFFDTRPILNRLHLGLEDIEVEWLRGEPSQKGSREISFLDIRMERLMAMTAAVTALGTKLYGRFGEGKGQDKAYLNQVKKDADAISAYAMSESLWFASRYLPENHAIMVSLGEGLMPKSGETQEMGSNPQLGFGRVYARPQVSQWLDQRVTRMLNEPDYRFDQFYDEVKSAGLTVWGAAIDTLENTSRFAMGRDTGPMTVLHLFNQPLCISRPYEGYMGSLFLPQAVVDKASERSVLIDYSTPRALVVEAIEATYPGIRREDIHVWTLRGKGRVGRIGKLWEEWEALGVHLVDDGWKMPSGMEAFTESGTYAPNYSVGSWQDADGGTHVFICDGYAASAEAMQAVSLAPVLGLDASLAVFTSRFDLSYRQEQKIMGLDVEADDFPARLAAITGNTPDTATVDLYHRLICEARDAGIQLGKRVIRADDFFPEKRWDVISLVGYMQPDPYTGAPGVTQLTASTYRVTVRLSSRRGDKRISFTLRLMERPREGRLVFNPLLIRFIWGEDFHIRPVKISDSGRIRNELQTLCSEALEYTAKQTIRVHFDRIPSEVISRKGQEVLLEVLHWYQEHHPIWFKWLEIVDPDRAGFPG